MDPEPLTGIAALFGAVDISSLSTNVSTLLVAIIGVSLLFFGYRYIRRVIGK